MLTMNAHKRVKNMMQQEQNLLALWSLGKFIVAVLLLASVVHVLSGCQSAPPVPGASAFRPPYDLMKPAPTQYLLSPAQQRKSPSSTTAPSQP